MRTLKSHAKLLTTCTLLVALIVGVTYSRRASAQVSVLLSQGAIPTTTLSAAIPGSSQGGSNATTMTVASLTNLVAGQYALIDQETVQILSVPAAATTPVPIRRGQFGSTAVSHPNSSTVYARAGYQFQSIDPPIGSCGTATTTFVPMSTPWINTKTGTVSVCSGGVWQNVSDAYVTFPATGCNSSVSGNSTGTNGYTTIGTAPSLPIVQAQTSVTGTNTHYYMCPIAVPSRVNVTRGVYLVDSVFYYGVQTTGLGTQVAALASGTMNSTQVFGSIAYPTAGASETATGLAQLARADAGSLTITPAVGSFNVATTTAGQFYSVKFAPATPFALTTDLTQYFLSVGLLNTATSATITNSPGYTIHYRFFSEGHVAR